MFSTIWHSAAVRFGHRNSGALVGVALLGGALALMAVAGGMLAAARWVEAHAAGAWAAVVDVAPTGGLILGAALVLLLAVKVVRFWLL